MSGGGFDLSLIIVGGRARLCQQYSEFATLEIYLGQSQEAIQTLLMKMPHAIILITSRHYEKEYERLQYLNGECYILYYTERAMRCGHGQLPDVSGVNKIPKTLHYIWFGHTIPSEYQKYIDGWKKWHPDWEIIKHDETNYNINKHPYTKEAYQRKRFELVSDYARLDILHEYGGIYLDCDVEVIKSLDRFLTDDCFLGFTAAYQGLVSFHFSIMGAKKRHPLCKKLMDTYDTLTMEDMPHINVHQKLVQDIGFCMENRMQWIDGISVYPIDVFTPVGWIGDFINPTENTHAIHHWGGAWHDNERNNVRKEAIKRTNNEFLVRNGVI